MHLVRPGAAAVAGEAERHVGQGSCRERAFLRHHAKGNHSAVAAATRHLEVVVPHGSNLSCQGERSIVGRLSHPKNRSRTNAYVESVLTIQKAIRHTVAFVVLDWEFV